MPGCNSTDGARPAFPLRYGGFTKLPAPSPGVSLWSRLRLSGFESQKAFQPKLKASSASRCLNKSSRGLNKSSRGLNKSSRGLNKSSRGLNKSSRGLNKSSRGLNKCSRGLNKSSRGLNKSSRGLNKSSTAMRSHTAMDVHCLALRTSLRH